MTSPVDPLPRTSTYHLFDYVRSGAITLILTLLFTTQPYGLTTDGVTHAPSSGGTPSVVHAGWPVFDISNLLTAMQQFIQIKQQIDTARETYQAIRKDFEIIADLTGIDAINDFFKPVDGVLVAYDDFTKPFDQAEILYNELFPEDPTRYEGNLADAWNYTNEVVNGSYKDQILQASYNAENLRQTLQRIQSVRDCADGARGSLEINRCMVNSGLIQAYELSTLKAQIIRQGMYTALRGNNDYLTQTHRRMLWNEIIRDAQNDQLSWTTQKPRKTRVRLDVGGDHH